MNKKYTLPILALLAITICAPMIASIKACTDYDYVENWKTTHCIDWYYHQSTLASIKYMGTERTQSGVKFIYEVTAGSQSVTKVELYSSVFKKIALNDASEGAIVKAGCISFTMDLKPGEKKTIWFELQNNYDGIGVGCISYKLFEGCTGNYGSIKGPVLNTNLCFPHA